MNKLFIPFLFLITSIISCSDNKDVKKSSKSHLHPISYTLYSDHIELFVEFNPLIVNEVSKFAAHFTSINGNFKAIETGSAKVSLLGGKKQEPFIRNAPKTPGIFQLGLQPRDVGTYDLVFEYIGEAFNDTIIIKGIKVYPNKESALNDMLPETNSGNELTYLKEQAWKIDFSSEEVIRSPFSEIIQTTGQIVSAQGDEIMLTAKSSGIVSFGDKKIQIGSSINSGENLLLITGSGINEDNSNITYQKAKLNFENSKKDFLRAEKLFSTNVISDKQFEIRKLAYEEAELNFQSIAKNYTSNGQKITSPFQGFIKNLMVSEGQYVEKGQAIARVSQNRRLLLTAEVPQKYFSKLNNIVSANFKTPYHKEVYETRNLNGKLISYGKSTSNSGFQIPVNFEIDNKGDLFSGTFIDIYLKINLSKNEISIPMTSLLEEQGHYYVYVQLSGESFEKREVTLGENDGINTVIRKGLNEHERIVTKGAFQIKLSTMSGKMPAHGHSH